MLRRLADAPVRGENFYVAKIEKGAVRAAQTLPSAEF
jgi:hypothetical protein